MSEQAPAITGIAAQAVDCHDPSGLARWWSRLLGGQVEVDDDGATLRTPGGLAIDAHLSNFGAFASPERRLLFDLNDFDETLPGPFEYDVKRLAASFTIAGRNNGFTKADTKAATLGSLTAYREAMAGFAAMGTLAIWYAHLDEDQLLSAVQSATAEARKASKKTAKAAKQVGKNVRKGAAKARTRDSLRRCRSWVSGSTAGTGS